MDVRKLDELLVDDIDFIWTIYLMSQILNKANHYYEYNYYGEEHYHWQAFFIRVYRGYVPQLGVQGFRNFLPKESTRLDR